jgi:hypothetical protein
LAIAHVCPRCGVDLARVRAARDPHYGFMIVRCPGCARVTVRRRHPLRQGWRRLRRLDWTLTALLLNQLAMTASLAAMGVAAIGLVVISDSSDMLLHWRRALPGLVLALTAPPMLAGTWLATGMRHWPGWTAHLLFGAIMIVIASGAAIVWLLIDLAPWLATAPSSARAVPFNPGWIEDAGWRLLRGTSLVYVMMLMTPAGRYPARGLLALAALLRRAVFRWRLRRQRRWRTA